MMAWPWWRLWIPAILLMLVFSALAIFLFDVKGPDSVWRAISEALIEMTFVVLLGAGLTHVLHQLARARAAEEATHAGRRDVMRRLAAADSEVASAQRLLKANQTDQRGELRRIIRLFEEIGLDLKTDDDLFPPEAEEHVRQIISYLQQGVGEQRPDLPRSTNFIDGKESFETGYREPFQQAKAAMRGQVTRP